MARLTSHQTAPALSTQDIFDRTVDLSDYRGRKVLLSFYRYASCPLCNLRVNELIKRYPEWREAGLEIIAVFQSPTKSILQYVGKQDAPFPIVPDPEHTWYEAYGVEGDVSKFLTGVLFRPKKMVKALTGGFMPGKVETDLTMIPADFLIDENGIIHTAYYGKDASDHLDTAVIESFLNQ